MLNNPLNLDDFLAILGRRKWHVGIPAAIILLLSAALAYTLPPVYVSTSTILVEQQEIPQDFVASTVTAYAAERVEKIRLRAMTTDKLWAIAEKADLSPEIRTVENRQDIVSQIRDNVGIEMVVSEGVDPRTGRTITPTIAFKVSYANESPEKAQAVTAELAQLFLEEDRRSRTENVQQTSSFLNEEAQRLQNKVIDLEAKISAFKVKNAGSLPESQAETSRVLQESRQQLELQNANLAPLESRYAYLQDRMASFGSSAQLAEARSELAAARQKYSEIHPDVVRLKRTIATLEAEEKAGGSSVYGVASNDPAYLELQAEAQKVAGEIGAIRSQRAVLTQNIAQYQSRLAQSPEVEREYAALTRDLDRATSNYSEIMDKLTSAQLAEELERTQKGERFTLMGAASYPTAPSKPNKPAIFLLGFTFALGVGGSIAALAEFLDRRIHGPKELAAVFKAPPLAIIPEIPG